LALAPGPVPLLWKDSCPPFFPKHNEAGLLHVAMEAQQVLRERYSMPLVLVIIDTLAAAANFKDENDAAETQRVMGALDAVSKATGALVLAVDHLGKVAEVGTRGSSAKEGSADFVLAALGERELAGTVRNRRLAVRKLRGGEVGREIPFTLDTKMMGADADGDTVTTCTINWNPPAAPPESASDQRVQVLFLESGRHQRWRSDSQQ
jgi:hypothetical protein